MDMDYGIIVEALHKNDSDPIYNCENIQIFINNLAPFLPERTLNVNPCRAQPMQPSWRTGVLSPPLFKAKLRLWSYML